MNMDEKIIKILEDIQKGQQVLENTQTQLSSDIKALKDGQARLERIAGSTKTAIETLQAGQDDMREQLSEKANKADILDLKAELVKKIRQHEKRLDDAGIANPYKN